MFSAEKERKYKENERALRDRVKQLEHRLERSKATRGGSTVSTFSSSVSKEPTDTGNTVPRLSRDLNKLIVSIGSCPHILIMCHKVYPGLATN